MDKKTLDQLLDPDAISRAEALGLDPSLLGRRRGTSGGRAAGWRFRRPRKSGGQGVRRAARPGPRRGGRGRGKRLRSRGSLRGGHRARGRRISGLEERRPRRPTGHSVAQRRRRLPRGRGPGPREGRNSPSRGPGPKFRGHRGRRCGWLKRPAQRRHRRGRPCRRPAGGLWPSKALARRVTAPGFGA